MEIVPITEIRNMYAIDTDSITDNFFFFVRNIFLCFKGGITNVFHQLFHGRNKYSYPERTNIQGKFVSWGTSIL